MESREREIQGTRKRGGGERDGEIQPYGQMLRPSDQSVTGGGGNCSELGIR